MKKQILFLAIFTLAVLAGTNNAWGQVTNLNQTNRPIDPLSCIASSEPLHPFAGVPYIYKLLDNGAEGANLWTWYATKEQDFVSATGLNVSDSLTIPSGDLLGHSSHYGVATVDADSVSITWSTQILAATSYQGSDGTNTPTFVVGYATGDHCADNIQVYEINPKPNFTLDIANIHPVGDTIMPWDTVVESCVSPVLSATYNTTNFDLDMDYGYDTLYFEIAAANFVNNFELTLTYQSGLNGPNATSGQIAYLDLYTTLALSQSGEASGGANSLGNTTWDATSTAGTTSWTPAEIFDAANSQDVADGVSLFLRVIIWNNEYESLTNCSSVIIPVISSDSNS